MRDDRILFLGKKDDAHCARALDFARARFRNVNAHLGVWGEKMPEDAARWRGDYIISYLSRWVVPEPLLQRAARAAINFHPALPEYPGIGCVNFALYDDASEYGVTCHHMAAKVDTGPIVAITRFPVSKSDDVASLLARTYDAQLRLFESVFSMIADGKPLPVSTDRWTRAAYTRKEFNELFILDASMPEKEVRRRIRAVTYQHYKPTLTWHGIEFQPKS